MTISLIATIGGITTVEMWIGNSTDDIGRAVVENGFINKVVSEDMIDVIRSYTNNNYEITVNNFAKWCVNLATRQGYMMFVEN